MFLKNFKSQFKIIWVLSIVLIIGSTKKGTFIQNNIFYWEKLFINFLFKFHLVSSSLIKDDTSIETSFYDENPLKENNLQLKSIRNFLAAYMALEDFENQSEENDRFEKRSILLPRIGTQKRSILLPRIGQEKRAFHMPRVGRSNNLENEFYLETSQSPNIHEKKSMHMPRIGK